MISPDFFSQPNSELKILPTADPNMILVQNIDESAFMQLHALEDPRETKVLRIAAVETLPEHRRQGKMFALYRNVLQMLKDEGMKYLDGRVPGAGVLTESGITYTSDPSHREDMGGMRSIMNGLKAAKSLEMPRIVTKVELVELGDGTLTVNMYHTTLLQETQLLNPFLEFPEKYQTHWKALLEEFRNRDEFLNFTVHNIIKDYPDILDAQTRFQEVKDVLKAHPFLADQ